MRASFQAAVIAAVVTGVALAQSVIVQQGRAELLSGDARGAVAKLEPYVKTHPSDADAFFVLARAYTLIGDDASLTRADAAIRTAMKLAGGIQAEYEWAMGLIYAARGKTALALSRLRIASSGDPKGPHAAEIYRYAMDWGAIAWGAGDAAQALEAYARASRAAPANPLPLVHQGTISLALRQLTDALSALDRAVAALANVPREDPVQADAYYWRGRANEALGRFNDARADYRTALDRDANYQAARDALDDLRVR